GYQPVGNKPAIALGAGLPTPPSPRPKVSFPPSHDLEPSRTTATQLLVPLATYKVQPSGLRATALQPLPKGNRASGRQGILSITVSVAVSITEMVSLLALAT